jgi:transposase InsO family protein
MAKTTKTALAKELGISRSALYYKPKRPASDEELKNKIIAVMAEHPAYGHRRVAMALGMNKKPIIRVMKNNCLKPKVCRGWRPTKPEDVGRPETRVANALSFLCPIRSDVVWAGDFTYLWFIDRFWYVATVIDIYNREIVGWHIANHHTTALIMDAFSDAVRRTGTAPKYFHSDQGSEYVAGAYESLLSWCGTTPSHSRKSSPWQNGHQESLYSQFKLELGNVNRFSRAGELIEAIHQQIAYYNNRRIHSALKMPPTIFREKQSQKNTAYAVMTNQFIYSTK